MTADVSSFISNFLAVFRFAQMKSERHLLFGFFVYKTEALLYTLLAKKTKNTVDVKKMDEGTWI